MSFQVFISAPLYTKLSYTLAINPAQISGQAGDRIVDFDGTRTIMLKNVTQPFSPLFVDVSPTNTTYLPISVQSGLAADVTYQCDDDLYGTPTRGACFDAYDSIPMTDHVTFFGDRSNPGPVEVPMPWRTTSSYGTCVIEVTPASPGGVDHENVITIKQVASSLIARCVNSDGKGGIARRLGQNGNLQLTVQQYRPNVNCIEPPVRTPDPNGCYFLLWHMPASQTVQKFGTPNFPNIDVRLPTFIRSSEVPNCVIKVGMMGGPIDARWYDIYAAANAVQAMCVVDGEAGASIIYNEKISVQLENDGGSALSLPVGNKITA